MKPSTVSDIGGRQAHVEWKQALHKKTATFEARPQGVYTQKLLRSACKGSSGGYGWGGKREGVGQKKSLSVFFIGCCCCPSLHTQVRLSLRCTEVQPCRNTCTHVSSVALNIRKWGAACLKPNLQHVSTFALPPQLFVYCHTSPLTHHMHTHIQRNPLLTVDSDVFLQAITDVTC